MYSDNDWAVPSALLWQACLTSSGCMSMTMMDQPVEKCMFNLKASKCRLTEYASSDRRLGSAFSLHYMHKDRRHTHISCQLY